MKARINKIILSILAFLGSVTLSYHLVSGASITTIQSTDTLSASRTTINDNFSALNSGKMDIAGEKMLGIGTTSPWAKLSVNLEYASTSPVFVAATTTLQNAGSSTALLVDLNGRVGIGTSTIGHQFALAGDMYVAGNGKATTTTIRGLIDQLTKPGDNAGTSTFASGLASLSGLFTSGGLLINGGNILMPSGNTATSSFLASGLSVAGGGLASSQGLTITGGSLFQTNTATNTFAGGLTVGGGGLASSNGIVLSGGTLNIGGNSLNELVGQGLRQRSSTLDVTGYVDSGDLNRLLYNAGDDGQGNTLADTIGWLAVNTSQQRLGLATTTPAAQFSIANQAGQTYPSFMISTTTAAFATSTAFLIDSNGHIAIATTSTKYGFSLTGGAALVKEVSEGAASSVTIDWSRSNQQRITIEAVTTFTFTNGFDGGTYRLVLCQDATGGRTAIWPASSTIQWSGSDSPPSLTARAGHCDTISLLYTQGTSTPKYFGVKNGAF